MKKNVLTKWQRLVLSLLEEAGEEELTTLINTMRKRRGPIDEVGGLMATLVDLIDCGLVQLASSRDSASLRWIPLAKEEAVALGRNLKSALQWSSVDFCWRWNTDLPSAVALLTDAGFAEATRVLAEDGYPIGDDGQPM
jgi:hypothetical protein